MTKQTLNKTHKEFEQQHLIESFLEVAYIWQLSDDETFDISNLRSFDTFQLWKHGIFPILEDDANKRLVVIVAINFLLKQCFSNSSQRLTWLKTGPDTFQGLTPLEYMLAGDNNTIDNVSKKLVLRLSILRTA
ncbi:hypothetical protein [Sneathiella aquimaris]|uniref:hypothetical protein n=1 Tax=Sneathiella aquimaris TaxID=2599305 RepID=UPI00146A1678|nr:hypothetical protein [Sneathiella aquimaris]